MNQDRNGLHYTLLAFVEEATSQETGWLDSRKAVERFALMRGYLHSFGPENLLILSASPDERIPVAGITPRDLLRKGPDRSFIEQLVREGLLGGFPVDGVFQNP